MAAFKVYLLRSAFCLFETNSELERLSTRQPAVQNKAATSGREKDDSGALECEPMECGDSAPLLTGRFEGPPFLGLLSEWTDKNFRRSRIRDVSPRRV